MKTTHKTTHSNGLEIAVVGMAVRLPGVADADAFFERLCRGDELIRRIDAGQLRRHGVPQEELSHPAYVNAAGYLDECFRFDAGFFEYPPREAEFMDPQLRLLHECCWEALEAAGCDPQLGPGPIGLYAGSAQNMHWLRAVSQHVGDRLGEVYDLKMLYQREFFNTRVAYRLNLQGPAVTLDSTCSTSLLAVHMAAQGLLSGDCDVALAGGTCVSPLLKGYMYHEGMIQSPDGHCRPFDAQARGTVPGQGVGIVALKRLDDAIAAGHPILAVLKSSAINNDGSDKVGYTAPSVGGQARVVRAAMGLAEVDAEGVDFIECHGTATRIGDPIEIEALAQARGGRRAGPPCYVGSVKSNLGHLDAAAGIVGFIKAVQAVRHGVLPPTLHYASANPLIDFERGGFVVNPGPVPLVQPHRPVRGGVSSFGIGGTNVHAVVEEYLERRPAARDDGRSRLIPLSARTPEALRGYAGRLLQSAACGLPVAALARTLQLARRHHPVRDHVVAATGEQLRQQLQHIAAGGRAAAAPLGDVVFMFSGQGAQYPGMTRGLYEREPCYRRHVDAGLALLPAERAQALRALLLGDATPQREAEAAQTGTAQPLLFVVEHALARTLMDWGIRPAAMLGHSLGEYVAACLAGVFTPADALALVCERGRLMARTEPGAMLGVRLSEAEAARYLDAPAVAPVELAAVNSSALVTLAGPPAAIDALQARLERDGVGCTRLKTSHAYHSRMMDGILDEFRARVAATPRSAPQLPYRSTLTGAPIAAAQAQDPGYWCEHLRRPVRFADAAAALLAAGPASFIEVGPGQALATFVRSHAAFGGHHACLHSVRHPRDADDDEAVLLRTLGRLYDAGAQPDWRALSADIDGPFVTLPTYAFAATAYDQVAGRPGSPADHPADHPAGPGQPAATHDAAAPARPGISHPRPRLGTPYVEADGPVEQRLCALWRGIFRLDRIGTDDNFFELGGHSLLATRVLAEVREAFGVELTLNQLFEQPTVAGLARQVVQAEGQAARPPELLPADRSRPIPVSFQQRRLWMIDRLGGGSAQYNMASPFILQGKLDTAALQAALDRLVQRHETLRTLFQEADGEAVQVVCAPAALPVARIDLSGCDDAGRDDRQRELVRQDAQRPFDLACEWPVRVTLVRLAERRHLLLFNVHHIVSDGWSEVLLVREFGELYRALRAGREPALAPLPLQYADYAAWQRQWLVGDTLQAELSFWRERLAGIPPVHNLPLDRPRPAVPRHEGALLRRKLPAGLLQRLRELARSQGATLFMTLQAAFALLLARWSNSEDIVMGTPVAGRRQKALEPLIGFFVNTLLLRTDLRGNPGFLQLLQRTRDMALSAFEHQHLPFEMLVDELAPARSRNHAPLFQVLFALQNYERGGSLALDGLELERVEGTVPARFDLSLITAESPEGLFADWHYDTALFNGDTMARLAGQYETLLAALLAQPEQPVLNLPLLGDDERQTLLQRWQHHAAAAAAPLRIEAQFEACAARCPQAPAVAHGDRVLSYRQLDEQANQLSHHLAALGAAPGSLVALCLPTGTDMVVAMLAALKCGAAYVPLDPGYPPERLAFMLAWSEPAVLVTAAGAPAGCPAACAVLDVSQPALRAQLAALPAQASAQAAQAADTFGRAGGIDDPAYVIFTSGSTGSPKGVVISQRQMAASLASRLDYYPEPVSAFLLLNSISFDSSVPTIFATLLTGGTLCLCDEDQRRDAGAIAGLIERRAVSHVLCLPSVYNAVLDCIDGHAVTGRSLRAVILAAEMFTVAVKDRHFAHPTVRAALYNEYGPTECSVWSTVYRCNPQVAEATVPIGRSPGHARLYVLNPAGELAPIGVEGELFIGGDGVGAGYLRRDDLTAQRFLPDPFAPAAGARMYRSGDRVRWRADGELEFLGRMDLQVKLRGYRIELGEIEAVLERHAAVARAVARVVDDRLVAYVGQAAAAGPADATALRRFLSARLPDYMLPQAWVVLDALPLLPNGKVDLARLPAPQPQAGGGPRLLPRNAAEQQVLEAWCTVLKIEPPSVDQDFFSLGGDSILLLKLSALLSRQGLKFQVRDFHAEPTVAGMARRLEAAQPAAAPDRPAEGAQPLHPMQAWFLGGDATDLHHFNQAVLLHVDAGFRFDAAPAVVAALVARHDVLRLRFSSAAPGRWQAAYRDPSDVAPAECLCRVAVPAQAGASADAWAAAVTQAAEQIQRTLSLDGPLLKIAQVVLPDGSARLLIAVHHLVVDGVSWRVLLQDLELAWRQAAAGRPIELPARPVSFQRAVEQLRQQAGAAPVQAELPHWEAVLAEPLPAWDGPDAGRVADEASHTLVLDEALTRALLTTSQHAYGMNAEEVLLAALRSAMHGWRGEGLLGVLLEGHGRSLPGGALDVGETVGWFTAAYPVVFGGPAGSAAADPAALLRDTKERLRQVPARGVHYGALKYLSPAGARLDDRAFRAGAVAFNYLGQFDQAVHAGSLFAVAPESPGRNISPRRRRDAVLAFDGLVTGGRMRFSIKYNQHQFGAAGIRALAEAFHAAIARLAAHWQAHDLRRLTPSDVPMLDLQPDDLARWQARWPALRDAYPATAMQQGMLFQSLRDSGRPRGSFINQLVFDLDGPLDEARLRGAWQALLQRHDVFRTAFTALPRGGMAQLLLAGESLQLPFVLHDLCGRTPAEQRVVIDAHTAADRGRDFDLAAPPLSRVAVWRLAPERHRVLWTTHHAVIDGWSLPLALRTLLDAYLGRDAGAPAPGSFKRHVQWLQAQDRPAAAAYWRARLETVDAPCMVAGEGRGSPDSLPASHRVELDAPQAARLEGLARSAGVTLHTLVQCAWASLLGLYTGRTQVCFGSVLAGRPADLPGADTTVGLFINTVPVVMQVDRAAPLRAWMQQAHREHLCSQDFGHLALPDILALSPLGPRAALFNSVVVLESYPVDSIREAGAGPAPLRLTNLRSEESTGSGLTLVVMPGAGPGQGLAVQLMFHTGEFPPAQGRRIVQQLVRLLAALPDCADAAVHRLEDALRDEPDPGAGRAGETDAELLALLAELDADPETATPE